ncbi:hypothetical protein SDRG_10146 [Saprolegnia diclina VS20]|uniref:RING-type domain-containing protein n=1 Tax=Saprolegnia diclina (strain VS20) TaxID=1156394 RepID=T0RJ56_SAPDV|nr:hypothetical protein SDRG_10146 [Saprolegnia diclina VS20]EQC32403.1 hypothetical protein SDRG_10146 [Saprolegnia diclina VS20]|eukprot:XP_008614344.1 hypothetical protein SDRG_10146 [Saprolegnia diclina VS20]
MVISQFAPSMTKGVHINVNVQYKALPGANVANVIQVFESTTWANFMVTYIGPHLKAYTPTSTTILAQLPSWQVAASDDACVICMSPMDDDRIALPCQHAFHHTCIREWLSRRNTCPHCRHAFEKELSGKYAVSRLQTTLLLNDTITASASVHDEPVGGQTMNAVVQMTLVQAVDATSAACDVVVCVQAERLAGPSSPQKTRKRSLSTSDAAAALKRLRTG